MTNIKLLNETLLQQNFSETTDDQQNLTSYQYMAMMYAKIENSIAVLSDMKANRSYIYHGRIAATLGVHTVAQSEEIDSIWEEALFNKIHPDDLVKKHLSELHYFNLLKNMPLEERSNYHVESTMRIQKQQEEYVRIKHRMFYVSSAADGTLWLALCLYNFPYDRTANERIEGIIVNSATGEIAPIDQKEHAKLLSSREKEILALIRRGKLSKEIATNLSISINTVNRHRQNILEKLQVSNSHEASRIAELMQLF